LLLEQPVARTQAALQGVDAALVRAVDREHEAVEETAPLRGGSAEQAIHRGCQPYETDMIRKRGGGCDRLAVDAAFAADARFVGEWPLDSRAERREAQRALELGGDRPSAVPLRERHLLERRAAQSAPRRQIGDRLDQVGLARAVRTDQNGKLRLDAQACGAVAAEIRQRQAADAGGAHRMSVRAPPGFSRVPWPAGKMADLLPVPDAERMT
jgi:hypothetical protein